MKHATLRELTDTYTEIHQRIAENDGVLEEDDLGFIMEINDSMENKVDAIVHVQADLEATEERIKVEIKRLQGEQKRIANERKKLKDYMAYCLNAMGVKNIKTKFHRVFVRKTPERIEYDKDNQWFNNPDNPVVVEKISYAVSIEKAKEIRDETGELPRGMRSVHGMTVTIK